MICFRESFVFEAFYQQQVAVVYALYFNTDSE